MTTSASALPALPPNTDMRKMVERINVIVRWFNRPDLFVPSYAADTGSGTAYVTSPSTDFKVYEVGQIIGFKAANANTGTTPTLNVNGLGAGTITKASGALAVGDIAANSFNEVVVTSTTPTFQLISPVANATSALLSGATTFLGANVSLNNTTNFFDGPNTGSIGANGQTWLIVAVANIQDAASFVGEAAIFNGSAYIADSATIAITTGSAALAVVTIMAVVSLSAATTFTLRCKSNSTGSVLETTGTFTSAIANKATSITAVRIV